MEDKEEEKERERIEKEDVRRVVEELDREQTVWELDKTRSKDQERREIARNMTLSREQNGKKRNLKNLGNNKGAKGAPAKKLRFGLIREDWGEAPNTTPREHGPGEEQEHPSTVHPMDGAMEQQTPTMNTHTLAEQEGAVFTEGCDTIATSRPQPRLMTQQSITAFLLPRGRAESNEDSHDSSNTVKDDPFEGGGGNVVMDSNSGSNELENTQVEGIEHLDSKIGGQDSTDDSDVMRHAAPSNVVAGDIELSNQLENSEEDISGGGMKCEFKRGVCQEHKLKGDKKVTKTKVWKKKKFGYGYVTTTKTSYSCKLEGVQPAAPEQHPGSSTAISLSPVTANSNGGYNSEFVSNNLIGQEDGLGIAGS